MKLAIRFGIRTLAVYVRLWRLAARGGYWISAARGVLGAGDGGEGEVDAEAQQLGSDCFFGFLDLESENRDFYFGVLPEPEGRLGTFQHHFVRAPRAHTEPRRLLATRKFGIPFPRRAER